MNRGLSASSPLFSLIVVAVVLVALIKAFRRAPANVKVNESIVERER